jgi:hypothetical protein
MVPIRQNLQAQPKTLNKLSEHQINQSERKSSQKQDVYYLKKEEEPNILMTHPTEFAGSTQNPKKVIETSNKPIRTKNFQKQKYV